MSSTHDYNKSRRIITDKEIEEELARCAMERSKMCDGCCGYTRQRINTIKSINLKYHKWMLQNQPSFAQSSDSAPSAPSNSP
jgi:hypothetical protein